MLTLTVEDRLNDQLNEKDEKIAALEDANEKLTNQLNGSSHGWSLPRDIDDDATLPIPRLELVFVPHPKLGWSHLTVDYHIVQMHLEGRAMAIPLGRTTSTGGTVDRLARSPGGTPLLPYRDGARAMHDAAHFHLPLYAIVPGELPRLLDGQDYPHQLDAGRKARRPV